MPYIKALEHDRQKRIVNYEFAFQIEGARSWPTVGIAEGIRNQIASVGGKIDTSRGTCSDFRVEPSRSGRSVISCELNPL